MKRVPLLAAASIILLFSLCCSREGPGSPPRELLQTWSLYADCPNNAITFRGGGTYEWMECYTDDQGGEKIDRWKGKYEYVSEREIKVTHRSGAQNIYSMDTLNGKKVLRQGGFVFHPSR